MDFDDMELNDDDFNDDAQLTAVDDAKLKVIEQIRKYTNMIEENIKFQERSEYITNFRVLSRYISAMIDLDALENGGTFAPNGDEDAEAGMAPRQLSEEEILEKIQEIERGIHEIGMDDLRQVNPDKEEGTSLSLDDIVAPKKDGDDDDGSLDF